MLLDRRDAGGLKPRNSLRLASPARCRRSSKASSVIWQLIYHVHRVDSVERDVRERVKQAMRYPTFVMIAMALALVIINIFVIPVFAKVFAGFNAELPLVTRGLLGFRYQFLTATRGMGTMHSLFHDYLPLAGSLPSRTRGSLVAWEAGPTTTYGLKNGEERGGGRHLGAQAREEARERPVPQDGRQAIDGDAPRLR